MNRRRYLPRASLALILLTAFFTLTSAALAQWKESMLYSFQGGTDGIFPVGRIVFDKAGNLYGVTTDGGSTACVPTDCGTVFQLAPPVKSGDPWTETVIYVFKGNSVGDGNTPAGGLVIDGSGNLYGTTAYGGTGRCVLLGTPVGCGTVFELSPPTQKGGAWTETVLHSFRSGKDGYLPGGDLTLDAAGNLYGATVYGGGYGSCNSPIYQYCGTVFKLSRPKAGATEWAEQVLYSFKGGTDGANPNGGLLFDGRGVIYGTTLAGGDQIDACKLNASTGCGTVFELAPSVKIPGGWKEEILWRFRAVNDGGSPNGNLIWGSGGMMYGTTFGGGNGNGTIFRLTRSSHGHGWTEARIYTFTSCGKRAGCSPGAGLISGGMGTLYGTAGGGSLHSGLVFQLKGSVLGGSDSPLAAIYDFSGSPDGFGPLEIEPGRERATYGITQFGGTGQACQGGCGTVFEIRPQ
jgi:hypothetical protein